MLISEKQTPERWRKVKEALDEALEVPVEERPTVLERCLADDPTLIREAKTYLGLERELGDFIETPAVSLSPQGPRDPMRGRRVGPYKLERVLGRGGMGAVYLAVREDDYEKQVALKLIHVTMSTSEMVERFRKERQILAHLDHPHIARLLDGGTHEGLPYFVMEYVEGRPIHRYCDEERLSTRQRLELFLKVSSAVHFAHRNLVVHRDLKPGNILVTESGVPKLLDFGIAKLLGGESVTRLRERDVGPMTYQYASPEQVLGDPISTASDVYSLGVLLFELLTGHLPLKRKEYRSPVGMMKAIGMTEAPKPSTAIWREEKKNLHDSVVRVTPESVSLTRDGDPVKLQRSLSGDVDAILLKALRLEPERRYTSAEQFGEDVRRHLEGLPVEARTGSFGYRAGKFVRRHRVALITGGLFLVMVIIFLITLAVQLDQTRLERNRAMMAMDLLIEFLENPEGITGGNLTPEDVIRRGTDRFDERFARDLEAQANTLNHVGLVSSYRAAYAEAETLLRSAVRLRREKWGDEHPLVAESLLNLGHLFVLQREYATSEPFFREALSILRRHHRKPNRMLATAISNQATQLQALGRFEEAEALFREALEMKRALHGPEHLQVATTLANLASFLYDRGQFEAARDHYQSVLEIREKYLPQRHRELGMSFGHMGRALLALGRFDDAVPMFRKALEIRTAAYDENHPEISRALNNLAFALEKAGELEESEALYLKALRIREDHFGKDHRLVATVKRNLASLYLSRGEPALCESMALQALEIREKVDAREHWRRADVRSVLGGCLVGRGRFAEAEKLLLASYEVLREKRGPDSPYTRETRARLFQLYSGWGQSEEAEKYRVRKPLSEEQKSGRRL